MSDLAKQVDAGVQRGIAASAPNFGGQSDWEKRSNHPGNRRQKRSGECVYTEGLYSILGVVQVRVKIEGDNEPQPTIPREEGQVPFVFVGTVESISNAKVLLKYHLAHLKVRPPCILFEIVICRVSPNFLCFIHHPV